MVLFRTVLTWVTRDHVFAYQKVNTNNEHGNVYIWAFRLHFFWFIIITIIIESLRQTLFNKGMNVWDSSKTFYCWFNASEGFSRLTPLRCIVIERKTSSGLLISDSLRVLTPKTIIYSYTLYDDNNTRK